MKYCSVVLMLLTGCASSPKCGNPAGANTVYVEKKSCEIRIRQVVIGSAMQIPDCLKGPQLASSELTWVDSQLIDGKIQVGHFVLIPKTVGGSGEH